MSGIANEAIHRDPNAMFQLSVCADIVIALPIVGRVVFSNPAPSPHTAGRLAHDRRFRSTSS